MLFRKRGPLVAEKVRQHPVSNVVSSRSSDGALAEAPKTTGWQFYAIRLMRNRCYTGVAFPENTRNNRPDPPNNHGAKEWCWGFADGHAEWAKNIDTYQKLLDSYMTSRTEYGPGP